jgi:hypothetical protein
MRLTMKYLKSGIVALALFSSLSVADVVVIVNSNNNASISDNEISRLFLGKLKKYANGEKASPINQKFGSKVRKEFEQKVLKKRASQVKAYWSKQIFSGKGKPPKELSSDKEILTQVASNKAAIAYIDAASVNGSVKVVRKF